MLGHKTTTFLLAYLQPRQRSPSSKRLTFALANEKLNPAAPLEGCVWTAEAVIELAVWYYLRVGDAPRCNSRIPTIMTLPVPGYAMMREIDRIPNLEHRSWWHSELGQHLSRHCWCRADREGYLGGLPEIEVCRLRGWDWNTHQRRVELASAAAAAWLNRKQFQSGVPCFP